MIPAGFFEPSAERGLQFDPNRDPDHAGNGWRQWRGEVGKVTASGVNSTKCGRKRPLNFQQNLRDFWSIATLARGYPTDYGVVDFSQGTCPRLNFFDGDLLLLLFVLLIYFLLKSWRRPLRQTKGGMPEQKTKVLDTKPKNRTPTWTRTLPCFPAEQWDKAPFSTSFACAGPCLTAESLFLLRTAVSRAY